MKNPTIPGLYCVSLDVELLASSSWRYATWHTIPQGHWRTVSTNFSSHDDPIEDGRIRHWKGPYVDANDLQELKGLEAINNSVLRSWVMQLGRREQGVLLTAIRGCDLAPKYPLDSPERRLTAAIRYAVLVPFDEREVDRVAGSFMSRKIPVDIRLNQIEHYPMHWVTHVIHATEVLSHRFPDTSLRELWQQIYERFVQSLHMNPEEKLQMVVRLSEDRIKSGNIVT